MRRSSLHRLLAVAAVAVFAVLLSGCGSQPKPSASGQQQANRPGAQSSANKARTDTSTESGSPGATGKRGSGTGSTGQTHSPPRYSLGVYCYPSGKALVGKDFSKIPRDKLPVVTRQATIIRIMRLPSGKYAGTCVYGGASGAAGL